MIAVLSLKCSIRTMTYEVLENSLNAGKAVSIR